MNMRNTQQHTNPPLLSESLDDRRGINARPNLCGNSKDDFLAAAQALQDALRHVDEALKLVATDVAHGRNYLYYSDALSRHRADIKRLDAAHAARAELHDLACDIVRAAHGGDDE
jgi:hypothetical protein